MIPVTMILLAVLPALTLASGKPSFSLANLYYTSVDHVLFS
jgi:hypothetical protein